MSGQRVAYIRVSSLDQNVGRQLVGVAVDRTFTDTASGKDVTRPQLAALLGFVREGDTVIVHSMDRLARNLEDLRRIVRELTARGLAVQFVKEQLVFTGEDTAMATLLLSVMGAFAEFERALIGERQREGIALAKSRGVYKGRKRSLTSERAEALRVRAAAGEPKAGLAREFGISRQTLYQYLRSPTPVTVPNEVGDSVGRGAAACQVKWNEDRAGLPSQDGGSQSPAASPPRSPRPRPPGAATPPAPAATPRVAQRP